MTISTHITRLAKIFALALAAAAFAVPAAAANDGLVDDWFRDAVTVVGAATPPAGVDPATGRPLRESGGALVAYRSTTDGFQWDDFGIGAGAMLGLVLLLAGISLGALSMRHRSGTLRTS